jgi:hypothetical protein
MEQHVGTTRIKIYGTSVVSAAEPVEAFKKKVETATGKKNEALSYLELGKGQFPSRYVDISWLKACAEVYKISPDIRDYVLSTVPLLTSDIPNRNMQGFGLPDLISFNPDAGRMAYQTFVGKPTHINHQNSILHEAKGVNLDVALIPVPAYNVAKVLVLSAFDRTKDPQLAREILTKQRNAYSMGAMAGHFLCSICKGVLGPAVRRTCTCRGVDFMNLKTLGKLVNGKLQYLLAKDFIFFENSSVDQPADVTAIGTIL